MDMLKKRRLDVNGAVSTGLTPQDARKLMERFSTEQLLDILQDAVARHPDVLELVRSTADADTTQRKLFIRGLAAETTTEGLRSLFSTYGDLEEAIVILDKATAKSKGYGFATFKHVDGALLALKEPSKKIDGRVTVTQLAAFRNQGSVAAAHVSARKIYVANVPVDMPADRLLNVFLAYGEIEEGPLGFDKVTGESRGFALFVYKSCEGAQAALADPTKVVDGTHLQCKLAIEGKKGKLLGQDGGSGPGRGSMVCPPPPGPYVGYSPQPHHMNSTPWVANAGHYNGPYRMPPPSSMSGGDFPVNGHYWHSSASSYPGQHQPVGSSPMPRVPLGGMYPNCPPNY
ncbi:UBP1-associated protein 2C [Raphanus sativus]|uniref:UBP1-associated protein 2C-like n=1 Tax=Raphanus sativus TaxID=3726 RepID=A0A6J0KQZ4_RAPSA|nr:UBP1-associated protein 2C-like [Raphanus sativus]XP_056858074.1 UBP1-associated protein 2C-like [Raphanus sativus]KAJ4866022.1 UBP1-associated protein 2C [Raphanus sativus]KAJ4882083.1 UBP1-associated protein 2C [Raphanus sativus]